MESFSTRGLPAARKVTYWNEISRDTFAYMDVQPYDTGRFDGALCREHVGPVTFMDVFSAAVRIRHTRAHIAQMSSPSYLLLAPLQRELELTMEGVPPIRVSAGEFCLLDHARPYELVHGDAVRTICVDLPRQSWDARVPDTFALVGKRMRADSAISRMLVRHLQSVACEIAPDVPPSCRLDLARACSTSSRPPIWRASRCRWGAELLHALKLFVPTSMRIAPTRN